MTDGIHRLLTDKGAAVVMAALGDGVDQCRIIGGAVRDGLLDRPIHDIDIATVLRPEVTVRKLEAAGIKAVPTGLAHGTITAVVNGQGYEVTTLRQDVETDGRHAEVAFTDDWQLDASRRDFTFNALSVDRSGAIHDYFNGAADLAAGLVRFVGEPAERVQEDYLRILRFFRFFAWYGKGMPDPRAIEACRDGVQGIAQLSAERICIEMLKLLSAKNPANAIEAMSASKVLQAVLGERIDATCFQRLLAISDKTEAIFRLAALIPGDAKQHKDIAECLRLSNAARRRLISLATPYDDLDDEAALYHLGADLYCERALLAGAIEGAPTEARLKLADDWTPKMFPIAGRDLLDLGMAKGPGIGAMLADLETWWIASGFKANRAVIRAEAASRIARGDSQ